MPLDEYARLTGSDISELKKKYPGEIVQYEDGYVDFSANLKGDTNSNTYSSLEYDMNGNIIAKIHFGNSSNSSTGFKQTQEMQEWFFGDRDNSMYYLTEEEIKFLREVKKEYERQVELQDQQLLEKAKALADQKYHNAMNSRVFTESTKIPQVIHTTNALKNDLSSDDAITHILQQRTEAIIDFQQNPGGWDLAYYSLTDSSREYMKNKSIKIENYTSIYGTKIQRYVQTEIISIINEASNKALSKSSLTYECQMSDCVLFSSEAAHVLNTYGNWVQALELNDFSLTLLNPELHHHLFGQLSEALTILSNNDIPDVSPFASKLRKTLIQINNTSLNGKQLITTVEKYVKIAKKHNELYVEIVHIIESICADKLSHMPCTKICNILDDQYASVYLQGLRKVAPKHKKHWDILYENVQTIIGNKWCERPMFFGYLLKNDLHEKISLIIHPNFKDRAGGLLNKEGICQEYALAAHITQTPSSLCTNKETAYTTYILLDQYQNATTNYQQEQANKGLICLKKSISEHEPHIKETYQTLAKKYALLNDEKPLNNAWDEYLEINYIDQAQQKVQNQCMWIAEKITVAQEEMSATDQASDRLLHFMEDQLEDALVENEDQNPHIAQDILRETYQIFFNSNSVQEIYKKNNSFSLKDKLQSLANQQKKFIDRISIKVNNLPVTLDEKLKTAVFECNNACLQAGNVISKLDTTFSADKDAISISDLCGFILTTKDNTIEINHVNESDLKDFQQLWPDDITLEEEVELWHEELEIWEMHGRDAAIARYDARKAAYEKTKESPYIFIDQNYQLSNDANTLLQDNEKVPIFS